MPTARPRWKVAGMRISTIRKGVLDYAEYTKMKKVNLKNKKVQEEAENYKQQFEKGKKNIIAQKKKIKGAIVKMRSKVEVANKEKNKWKDTFEALQQQHDGLAQQLADQAAESNPDCDENARKLEEADKETANVKTELEECTASLNDTIDNLKAQLQSQEANISEMSGQSTEVEQLKDIISELRESLEQASDGRQMAETSASDLQKEVDRLTAEKNAHEDALRSVESEKEAQEQKTLESTRTAGELRQTLREKTDELERKNQELTIRIEELETVCSDADSKVKTLETQLVEATSLVNTQADATETAIKKEKLRSAKLTKRCKQLMQKLKLLKEKKDGEIASSKQALSEAEKARLELDRQRTDAQAELQKYREQMEQVKEEAEKNTLETQRVLESQMLELRQENDTLNGKLTELATANDELDKAQQLLQTANSANAELHERINNIQQQSTSSTMNAEEESLKTTRQQLVEEQKRCKDLEHRCATFEHDARAVKKALCTENIKDPFSATWEDLLREQQKLFQADQVTIEEKSQQIKDLQTQLEQAQQTSRTEDESQLSTLRDQAKSLSEELSASKNTVEELTGTKQTQEGQIGQLRGKVLKLKEYIKKFKVSKSQELNKLKADNQSMESQLETQRSENTELSKTNEQLQEQQSQAPAADPEELAALKTELEATKVSNKELSAKYSKAKTAQDILEEDNRQLTDDLDDLRQQLSNNSPQQDQPSGTSFQDHERLRELERETTSLRSEKQRLEAEHLQNANTLRDDYEARMQEMKGEYEKQVATSAQQPSLEQLAELEQKAEENIRLKEQLAQAEKTVETLSSEVESSKTQEEDAKSSRQPWTEPQTEPAQPTIDPRQMQPAPEVSAEDQMEGGLPDFGGQEGPTEPQRSEESTPPQISDSPLISLEGAPTDRQGPSQDGEEMKSQDVNGEQPAVETELVPGNESPAIAQPEQTEAQPPVISSEHTMEPAVEPSEPTQSPLPPHPIDTMEEAALEKPEQVYTLCDIYDLENPERICHTKMEAPQSEPQQPEAVVGEPTTEEPELEMWHSDDSSCIDIESGVQSPPAIEQATTTETAAPPTRRRAWTDSVLYRRNKSNSLCIDVNITDRPVQITSESTAPPKLEPLQTRNRRPASRRPKSKRPGPRSRGPRSRPGSASSQEGATARRPGSARSRPGGRRPGGPRPGPGRPGRRPGSSPTADSTGEGSNRSRRRSRLDSSPRTDASVEGSSHEIPKLQQSAPKTLSAPTTEELPPASSPTSTSTASDRSSPTSRKPRGRRPPNRTRTRPGQGGPRRPGRPGKRGPNRQPRRPAARPGQVKSVPPVSTSTETTEKTEEQQTQQQSSPSAMSPSIETPTKTEYPAPTPANEIPAQEPPRSMEFPTADEDNAMEVVSKTEPVAADTQPSMESEVIPKPGEVDEHKKPSLESPQIGEPDVDETQEVKAPTEPKPAEEPENKLESGEGKTTDEEKSAPKLEEELSAPPAVPRHTMSLTDDSTKDPPSEESPSSKEETSKPADDKSTEESSEAVGEKSTETTSQTIPPPARPGRGGRGRRRGRGGRGRGRGRGRGGRGRGRPGQRPGRGGKRPGSRPGPRRPGQSRPGSVAPTQPQRAENDAPDKARPGQNPASPKRPGPRRPRQSTPRPKDLPISDHLPGKAAQQPHAKPGESDATKPTFTSTPKKLLPRSTPKKPMPAPTQAESPKAPTDDISNEPVIAESKKPTNEEKKESPAPAPVAQGSSWGSYLNPFSYFGGSKKDPFVNEEGIRTSFVTLASASDEANRVKIDENGRYIFDNEEPSDDDAPALPPPKPRSQTAPQTPQPKPAESKPNTHDLTAVRQRKGGPSMSPARRRRPNSRPGSTPSSRPTSRPGTRPGTAPSSVKRNKNTRPGPSIRPPSESEKTSPKEKSIPEAHKTLSQSSSTSSLHPKQLLFEQPAPQTQEDAKDNGEVTQSSVPKFDDNKSADVTVLQSKLNNLQQQNGNLQQENRQLREQLRAASGSSRDGDMAPQVVIPKDFSFDDKRIVDEINVNRRLIKMSLFEVSAQAQKQAKAQEQTSLKSIELAKSESRDGEVNITCSFTRTFLITILMFLASILFVYTDGNDTAMQEITHLIECIKQTEVYQIASTWMFDIMAQLFLPDDIAGGSAKTDL